ncbi:MAG: hypothetical protein J6Q55_01135 [Clostridia bacterium]|nr:hypothetical protein [Clostridia bacterium]
MKQQTKQIFSLALKFVIVAVVVVGIVQAFLGNAVIGASKTLLYYTNQSNLLMAAIC